VIRAPLGPVMLDVAGTRLTDEDRTRLSHPLVGGVILFQRNYDSPEQIAALNADIRALRAPELLIAVDQEGGRVQRFRAGYTPIPPMAELGALWDVDRAAACDRAEKAGFVIATELTASGVDFSFAPVLDIGYGSSRVIGDRAFHRDPEAVSELAAALIAGLARGGAGAVGKHFPGHGFAAEDSHVAIPVDPRPLSAIRAADLSPYRRLRGELAGVMPAHVIYPEVDPMPAGFSRVWLQQVLRREIGFEGVIFSDDLSMEAAAVAGDIVARANTALAAGCDMVLVCNRPEAADALLAHLAWHADAAREERVARLRARAAHSSLAQARADPAYQLARNAFEPQARPSVASRAPRDARS